MQVAIRAGWLLIFCLILSLTGSGQAEHSALMKRKWYDGAVRLVKGGDHHFYLIRHHGGQYWSFGRSGLRRFDTWRFGPDLEQEEIIPVGRFRRPNHIENAFEVLPTPNGIAFLCIAKQEEGGLHELQLCEPDFGNSPPSFTCRTLAVLHNFSLKLSLPDIRTAFSPDSSRILITWRKVADRELSDRATACLVLNREMETIAGPFSPFLGAQREFQLLRIGITDEDRLLFWVRAFREGGVLNSAVSGSFHFLEYDGLRSEMREVRLDNSGRLMMDAQLHFDGEGIPQVCGWWINGRDADREAGIFMGRIGIGDTLEGLRLSVFDEEERREMLPRVQANGDVLFRPSYHNQLLPHDSGFVYVLSLLGRNAEGTKVNSPGKLVDNLLLAFDLDLHGNVRGRTLSGFCNDSRSDYKETGSWIPLRHQGEWHALVADYSEISSYAKSWQGRNYLIPLLKSSAALRLEDKAGAFILSPRLFVREARGRYVFLAKSRKFYQLVRKEF